MSYMWPWGHSESDRLSDQAVGAETARRLDRFLEGVCITVKPLFFQLDGDPY